MGTANFGEYRALTWRGVRNALFGVMAITTQVAFADGESSATNAEISHLMSFIQTSSCEFNRNGTWYPSTMAHEHISKKLNYLRDQTTIPNAEFFIKEAASRSSMGERAMYQIRCASAPVQECRSWLLGELTKLRNRVVKR